MQKFNSTRTLFPSYTDISDVRVHLPSGPSRASVARDLDDLWEIRESEPHITVLTDPGVEAPLPQEDGFDPQGLSEDSPQNILVNRGSEKPSKDQSQMFEDALRKAFTTFLESNKSLKSYQVGELKSLMRDSCPGSLFVYNMNDISKLIQALSLIQAIEKISVDFVRDADFPDEMKEHLISFIGGFPSIRTACLLPDYTLRQKLLGNTESIDTLDESLKILGKLPTQNPAKVSIVQDEFKDYREAAEIAQLRLNIETCVDISQGLAFKAILNSLLKCCNQICSREAVELCASLVNELLKLNFRVLSVNSDKLVACLSNMFDVLESIDAAPSAKMALENTIRNVKSRSSCLAPKAIQSQQLVSKQNIRSAEAVAQSIAALKHLYSVILSHLKKIDPNSAQATGLSIELLCCLSLIDCCESLKNKASCNLNLMSNRLFNSICDVVKKSSNPVIHNLKEDLERCEHSLESAQKLKTLQNLRKANSENIISDKKLETLTKFLD